LRDLLVGRIERLKLASDYPVPVRTMSSSIKRNEELQVDVKVLKGILYDIVERSIIFQQKAKEQFPHERKAKRALLKSMMKFGDMQNLLFFDPAQVIEDCFDENRTIDLAKMRHVRDIFIQLAINVDKVTVRILSNPNMTLSEQVGIYVHLFDGLEKDAKEQHDGLRRLQKMLRSIPGSSPPTSMTIESLSKTRIICTFYIKWLTIADNEYTDREIAKADLKTRQEFDRSLTKNFDTISKTELLASIDNLDHKLDTIEQKMDAHSLESKLNQDVMINGIAFLKILCTSIVEKCPKETGKFVESKMTEILELLSGVAKSLEDEDTNNSIRAKSWKNRLQKGVGTAADLIQLFTFIVGLPSLPALFGSSLAVQAFAIVRDLGKRLKV
jgi:hypothetical protein